MPLSINEANINLALQALRKESQLSLYRASEIYKVSHRTLRRRHNGIPSRHDTIPNSGRLPDLDEQTIVQCILDPVLRGFPPRLRGFEEIANRLLADRDVLPIGKRWAFTFVKRQPELKMPFNRRYDYKTAKCEDLALIRSWFTLVENVIAKHSISLTYMSPERPVNRATHFS
ncbi:hypothetical protein CFIMG_008466RA00001 [Ceratocystis fimbriata CBS 114723]|uniref:HTH psq-type domain-containing protein n=1 Tax=Ceratocystis fimbriata CBS 114723 TaxID=1035309 RepID=A0A2C5X1F0_9PEZI|nr:hypothetical protein CFIMG_008466RA00001 [Ceratocystis fimbriata CBS 114723]